MIVCLLAITAEELTTILKDSTHLEAIIEDEEERVDNIDKAWDGIIYLLSGRKLSEDNGPVSDLSRVVLSGQIIDEAQDLGMGPAHYLTPEQVEQSAMELAQVDQQRLRSAFDSASMKKARVYPEIWDQEESFDFLMENLDVLKAFYKTAAADGNA